MRTPHLAAAALAASMMAGMGGHATEVQAVKATADTGPLDKPFANSKGRWHPNQRQIRKDRRRAHAAGCKNAFA